jgi:hypothetical protein
VSKGGGDVDLGDVTLKKLRKKKKKKREVILI